MDLQINSKSHVPVHVQLEGQIKHLILAGRFEVGSRLPSIRALAGYLRVNRNTVARVISDLEREGYVESRRGSGVYVLRPPVDEEEAKRHEVLERVMDLAAARGIPVEELGYALLARGGSGPRGRRPSCSSSARRPNWSSSPRSSKSSYPSRSRGFWWRISPRGFRAKRSYPGEWRSPPSSTSTRCRRSWSRWG